MVSITSAMTGLCKQVEATHHGAEEHDQGGTPKRKTRGKSLKKSFKRGSVTGADAPIVFSRGNQVLRREEMKRSSMINLESLSGQALWKEDTPDPIDRGLEEELTLRQARLTALIEVNRALHDALVKKKIAAKELEEQSKDLQTRLVATMTVEGPAQRQCQQDLEDLLREERTKHQAAYQEFTQMNIECEDRVRELQEASRTLQEVNGNNRKLIKEQAMEIKERQKAIKDLQRHVHLVEGAESEDKLMPLLEKQLLMANGGDGSRTLGSKRTSHQEESSCGDDIDQEEEGSSVASGETLVFNHMATVRRTSVQDTRPTSSSGIRRTLNTSVTVKGTAAGYRRLPGLNLEKLLNVGLPSVSKPPSPLGSSKN